MRTRLTPSRTGSLVFFLVMPSPKSLLALQTPTIITTTLRSRPLRPTGKSPLPNLGKPCTNTRSRDLYTLGRWDVGANVFANVASQTGDRLRKWSTTPALSNRFFNSSYSGIFNSKTWAPQPVPDSHSRRNGRTTLPSIKAYWEPQQDKNYYHGQLEIPDGANPPVYPYSY